MESDAPLPGPDLMTGVPLNDVPASGVLAGHGGGESLETELTLEGAAGSGISATA